MTRLADTVRKIGLTPILKPVADQAARAMGMRIIPEAQVPDAIWRNLSAYSIRTVLDIGACRGGFAADILVPWFPKAQIHSFEPSPDSFGALQARASASGGRIVPHNFGLGEKAEVLALHSTVNALPSSSLLASTEVNKSAFPKTIETEDRMVDIRVLDEVAPSLTPGIQDDLLVKIDVQGFEDRVIRGGRNTIARARIVIVEVQESYLYSGQPTFKDIFLELDALGLRFSGVLDQHTDTNGKVLYYDAVFERPAGTRSV